MLPKWLSLRKIQNDCLHYLLEGFLAWEGNSERVAGEVLERAGLDGGVVLFAGILGEPLLEFLESESMNYARATYRLGWFL